MKVILNKCYGGFDVSDKGYKLYAKKKNIPLYVYKEDYSTRPRRCKKINDIINDTTQISYFTKDFGDCFEPTEEDWKYNLWLDEKYREDAMLIEVVEELGEKANGRFGKLVVVEIPDGMKYVIDNYDGIETLHEDVPVW